MDSEDTRGHRPEYFMETNLDSRYISQHYLLTGVDVAGFSKIFSSMWGGSMYGRFEASAVFMVLLSLCDKDGVVDMTPEAVAGTTGWPLDLIRRGIDELAEPDQRSRTPDEAGRRIVPLDDRRDWGWRITNYKKYRDQMRSAERREYLRQKKAEERSRAKSTSVNTSTKVNQGQPIADTDTDTDTEADINTSAWALYVEHRKELKAKPLTTRGVTMARNKLAKLSHDDQMTCVETTVANGWTGLFPEKVKNETHHSKSFDQRLQVLRDRAGVS